MAPDRIRQSHPRGKRQGKARSAATVAFALAPRYFARGSRRPESKSIRAGQAFKWPSLETASSRRSDYGAWVCHDYFQFVPVGIDGEESLRCDTKRSNLDRVSSGAIGIHRIRSCFSRCGAAAVTTHHKRACKTAVSVEINRLDVGERVGPTSPPGQCFGGFGDRAKSATVQKDLLTLWKDADPMFLSSKRPRLNPANKYSQCNFAPPIPYPQ
jgi:hypothetical protein